MQPCKQPGCSQLVPTGFCDDHRKAHRPKRKGASIYNSKRWKLLRRKKLRTDPICEECGNELATEVDHIEGIETHPELAFVFGNLRSLCKRDHSAKTNAEVRNRRYA